VGFEPRDSGLRSHSIDGVYRGSKLGDRDGWERQRETAVWPALWRGWWRERADRWGPRVSEMRERRCREGKHIFEKTPMGHMPNGPAEQSGGLRGRNGLARWTGLVGPDPSGKTNGNLILNFN
jgi:hypothetical protein